MRRQLWNAKVATVAAPTLITDGVNIRVGGPNVPDGEGFVFNVDASDDEYSLFIKATADVSVLSLSTVRLYGWSLTMQDWFLFADINNGAALAETSADKIAWTERVRGIREFSRLALTAVFAGTNPIANAWLVRL